MTDVEARQVVSDLVRQEALSLAHSQGLHDPDALARTLATFAQRIISHYVTCLFTDLPGEATCPKN